MRAHIFLRDVTSAATDHDRELALVVERCREARAQYRGLMPDLRIGKSRKDRRVLGLGPFRFGAMAYVIQADAENLLRIWNDRQKLNFIDRERSGLPSCRHSAVRGNAPAASTDRKSP